MNWLDRAIMSVAPVSGARRIAARAAITRLTAHYEATQPGNRGTSWRATRTDADAAAASRQRLSGIALDMVRNSPLATRAQQVIASNVVGDGIIPKVIAKKKGEREAALRLIEAHFDTTDINADGRNNLYGLQRLVVNALVASGEVLIRRRRRERRDGFALPFQIQVIEIDFLDSFAFGKGEAGNVVRDGIEYDAIGRRVAYHLLSEHPGARGWRNLSRASRRVAASEILHIYRQDRPGQMRGVSWFAPVALALQDMADHQDAQLMRQKIAACFAAFRVNLDGETPAATADPGGLSTLVPGRIQNLAPGEDIRFAEPPGVQGYYEFTRSVSRTVAAGIGVTYEALTGDLTGVNFSSARIGRLEMDRNVSAWQWLLLIPQMMQPLAGLVRRGLGHRRPGPGPAGQAAMGAAAAHADRPEPRDHRPTRQGARRLRQPVRGHPRDGIRSGARAGRADRGRRGGGQGRHDLRHRPAPRLDLRCGANRVT
ncbi:phage portal protein [Loktanella sp. M215]|uniref:phage portal protein n=1 Tax=Loktanella sp. M215 TaxID=2675431 RepID=UPI001F025A5D|nr:phage portal protein [Loktanella sp. M215]